MSQLAKVPLRTAKRLKKLKEIKKVETAIRWHERARKNRQAVATDRYESKQTVLGLMKWEKEQVKHVKSRALEHAREDWKLGPLRPNRAIGHEASTYGALDQEGMRRPPIPVRVQKHRNEIREKRGLELEYPLVVDDKKYFHIVEDDRVVVIKGREKGKIGIVSEVLDSSHEVVIKDLNTHYADGRVWNTPDGTPAPPKRETNNAIPLADVRLVVPYRITTTTASGEKKEIFQDVVVDKVIMERHTTGIDPYTGIDYGKDEFPEEHRFDPETGLPIFKRYIAGTRSLIQWPWEFDPEEHKEPEREVGNTSDEKSGVRKGRIGRSLDWLKSRTSGAKNLVAITKKQQEEAKEQKRREQDEKDFVNIEQGINEAQEKTYLKSKVQKLPPDSDDDTGRNLAEVSEESRSFYPTLIYPPFPNELSTELAEDIRLKARADAKDKSESDTARQDLARKVKEKKERAARREAEKLEVMKTPLQLRWEVERAKKLREEKPLVHMDALMLALGSHMQAQGIKLTPKRLKAAEKEVHVD